MEQEKERGGTYRRISEREVNLLLPAPFYSGNDAFLRNVSYSCLCIVLWVVAEYHSLHFVLGPSQPALFQVVEYSFYLSLRTRNIT
jgi:hypothetical protein